MTGFKTFLDDCAFTLGAMDEPPETDNHQMDVFTSNGHLTCDAVGMMELGKSGGVPALLLFDWVELDEEELIAHAQEEGIDLDDPQSKAEIEQLRGETIVLLRDVIPWQNIIRFRLAETAQSVFQ